MNVVIGGPSNSGKTCLRESLRLSIYRQSKIYPLYVPANTDGEGNWFSIRSDAKPGTCASESGPWAKVGRSGHS